jgi:2',3'-cyclic-nucleotide 2'-phosphodiesterase (5'-nucleotidase family)
LHTGTGLSDAASYSGSASVPNGVVSSDIFVHVDYDLLTIGNHELKNINTSHNIFDKFGKVYGNRYLTSNVDIVHPTTGNWVSIGARYRYFTTPKGEESTPIFLGLAHKNQRAEDNGLWRPV